MRFCADVWICVNLFIEIHVYVYMCECVVVHVCVRGYVVRFFFCFYDYTHEKKPLKKINYF